MALAVALGLACNALAPGAGSPAPAPATIGPTVPAVVTQPVATPHGRGPSPTSPPAPSSTAESAAPGATPALPPPDQGDALPRLAAGQPLTLTVIDMLTLSEGWAIGSAPGDANDHVLRTTDGGLTWRDVSPPEPAAAAASSRAAVGEFRDSLAGWVTYYARDVSTEAAALVWRTSDGGATWLPGTPLDMSDMEFFAISDLYFASATNGWLMAHVGAGMNHDYVVVFSSADGGQTWTRVVDPFEVADDVLQQSCLKTGLVFLNPTTGWATGDCQGVAPGLFFQRSDDGGRTWRQQDLPAPAQRLDAFERQDGGCGTYNLVAFPPGEVVVAVTCIRYAETLEVRHFLYASADGGATWSSSPLPARDYAWLDRMTGWAIDPADPNNPAALRRLYQTTDGGQTWPEINTMAWTAQLDFVDPANGWALARAGEETALVQSANGGASWALLEPESGP